MGTKWSTVSVSGYNSSPPSDDGSTTTANEVKWSTIKTKLPDPLKTALESVISKLDTALNFATTAKTGDYTIATTDNGKVIDFTASATATLPAASSAGDSFMVGIMNSHSASITISRAGSDTINGATSYTLPTKHMLWLYTNDANDGWLASQPVNLIVTGTLTAGAATVTSLSVSDGDITNVGDIAVDSISADATDINLAMTDNSATAFTVKEGSTAYMTFVTTNSGEKIVLGKDVEASGSVTLKSDAATLGFGADTDVTLTHVADTGLLLNSTRQLQFNDASQNITAPNATTLDINATDEVEINATLADVNANLDVSGTYTGGGTMTTGGNIVIPDAGNIGSASDTDAMSISSGGVVGFSQVPTFPNDTIETDDIQDNAVTLAKMAGLARGKIIVGDASGDPSVIGPGSNGQALVSDGTDVSFGTVTASVALDDIATGDAASTLATSAGNITIDAQGNDTDIILKGTDGSADTTFLTIDGSDAGTASFNHDVKLANDAAVLGFGADNDVTLTHVADTGLLLNSTMQLQFNDASQNITAPNATTLDINATDEVEINATLADVNANLDVSGTYTGGGLMTTGGNIVIPDAGNIGSASDTDAIAISSAGLVTVSQDLTVSDDVTIGDDLLLDSDGAVIKLGDDQDVTITHNADEGITLNSKDISGVSSINGGQIGGSRNYIYNGDTSICQRATSVANIGNGDSGYHVQDRYKFAESGAPNAEVTMSRATEVPSGFQYSMKFDCTTASGTVSAADLVYFSQIFEGQDLYGWKKGTSDALPVTLSFWVNTTKTGTYICSLYDNDNARNCSQAYTVSSSNTWEYKSVTFPGDTTGAFGRDANASLYVHWGLVAGTDWTSGTLATAWQSSVSANQFVGQVDAFDNTSNNFHITGIQLELGETASAFQTETYIANLQRCQRYLYKVSGSNITGQARPSIYGYIPISLPVQMRAAPTLSSGWPSSATSGITTGAQITKDIINTNAFKSGAGFYFYVPDGATASAEL
tara:strand:- start:3756 stop:6749 length:2994 start_codon:yes stop_codon:yes gene_type:complete